MCSVANWDLEQVCLPHYLCVAHLTLRMGTKESCAVEMSLSWSTIRQT